MYANGYKRSTRQKSHVTQHGRRVVGSFVSQRARCAVHFDNRNHTKHDEHDPQSGIASQVFFSSESIFSI